MPYSFSDYDLPEWDSDISGRRHCDSQVVLEERERERGDDVLNPAKSLSLSIEAVLG